MEGIYGAKKWEINDVPQEEPEEASLTHARHPWKCHAQRRRSNAISVMTLTSEVALCVTDVDILLLLGFPDEEARIHLAVVEPE